jgi:hypothetical protein
MALPNNINIPSEITWENASMSDRIHLFEKISTSQTPSIPKNTKSTMNPQLKSYLLQLMSKRKATIQQLFEDTGILLDTYEDHSCCVSFTTTFYVGLICCAGGFAIASYLKG